MYLAKGGRKSPLEGATQDVPRHYIHMSDVSTESVDIMIHRNMDNLTLFKAPWIFLISELV